MALMDITITQRETSFQFNSKLQFLETSMIDKKSNILLFGYGKKLVDIPREFSVNVFNINFSEFSINLKKYKFFKNYGHE